MGWLNSDKELNHLSTVSWRFSGAYETPVWFLTGISREFFLLTEPILEDSIMKTLLSCEFNMDTGCVELRCSDDSMISINCTAVEDEVANSRFQRSELDWLIYNDPLSYAELILNGDPEKYLRTVTEIPQLDSDW